MQWSNKLRTDTKLVKYAYGVEAWERHWHQCTLHLTQKMSFVSF